MRDVVVKNQRQTDYQIEKLGSVSDSGYINRKTKTIYCSESYKFIAVNNSAKKAITCHFLDSQLKWRHSHKVPPIVR